MAAFAQPATAPNHPPSLSRTSKMSSTAAGILDGCPSIHQQVTTRGCQTSKTFSLKKRIGANEQSTTNYELLRCYSAILGPIQYMILHLCKRCFDDYFGDYHSAANCLIEGTSVFDPIDQRQYKPTGTFLWRQSTIAVRH